MEITCHKCGNSHPDNQFRKDSRNKSGYDTRCRTCENARGTKYRIENPETFKSSQAKYNATGKRLMSYEKYREANPNYSRDASARWLIAHPEQAREKASRWLKDNPVSNRQKSHRRRILMRGACFKAIPVKELAEFYNRPCVACGATTGQTIDHIVPISKGGLHIMGNLQTLCRSCNCRKKDKIAA